MTEFDKLKKNIDNLKNRILYMECLLYSLVFIYVMTLVFLIMQKFI